MDAIRYNVNHAINAYAGTRSACKFLILLRSVMNIFRKYTEAIFERGFSSFENSTMFSLKEKESIVYF